jgi:hypothetical protein
MQELTRNTLPFFGIVRSTGGENASGGNFIEQRAPGPGQIGKCRRQRRLAVHAILADCKDHRLIKGDELLQRGNDACRIGAVFGIEQCIERLQG